MNKRKLQDNAVNSDSGFTLVEVLVAMLVLAVGLLGLATLQTQGVSSNHTAYQRGLSTTLVNDMLDRIRANREGLDLNAYNNLSSISGSYTSQAACLAAGCAPAVMATHDMYEWVDAIQTQLPGGEGVVQGAGTGSVFTITVMWDDDRSGATGTGCDPANQNDLTCFTMSTTL